MGRNVAFAQVGKGKTSGPRAFRRGKQIEPNSGAACQRLERKMPDMHVLRTQLRRNEPRLPCLSYFLARHAFEDGGSALLDASVGVVAVDALLVLGLNAIPGHVWMFIQPHRHVAHEVFDEHGILVSPLGDGFFIRPLEQ